MVSARFSKTLPSFRHPAHRLPALLVCGISALVPQLANATSIDPRSIAAKSLEELLQTPVSIATRTEETFTTAPSSVTVFTRSEIGNMGIRTVEELLNYVPGFQSVRTASRSYYSVASRGRNSPQLSNDILFMINGRRLNDDFSGAALIFDRYLSTGNVQRVEVIRGPGSALYGSNAFLGVVNIITAMDLDELSISAGEPGYRAGHVNLSTSSEGLETAFFLGGFTDDGEKFSDRSSPVGASTRDPRQSLQAYGSVATGRLRLDARYSKTDIEDFWLFTTVPASEINDYESTDYSVDLAYTLAETERAKLNVSGGYRKIDSKSRVLILPREVMLPFNLARLTEGTDPFIGGPSVELSATEFRLDGSLRADTAHDLSAGLEYRRTDFEKLKNSNNYETLDVLDALILGEPGPIRFYDDVIETADFGPTGSHRTVWGGYLQDVYSISERTRATLGLRYDHYSDVGGNLSPRLAVVHSAPHGATYKLMYGEAFRAPTISELATVNTPTVVSNPDLDPERVKTLELAWLQRYGNVQTTLTGYYSRIEDQIRSVPVAGDDPRRTFINGDSEDLSGVELEIHADLTDRLFVRATAAHMLELPEDPRNASRNLASVIVNYRRGDWNLNLNGYHQSSVETQTEPVQKLEGHWLFNLNVRRDIDRLTLFGTVDNILNEDYATFTRTPIPGGTPNRGRTFRAGIEYRF